MRHRKHHFQLGRKREHRAATVAALAAALFTHGRIQTTLIKAKALRPFAERIITYAKKAALSEDASKKVHYRRLAIAKVRDEAAVKKLFIERASEFEGRAGGYTRIYKLGARIGDAAETALIELVKKDDQPYKKRSANKDVKKSAKRSKASGKKPEAKPAEVADAAPAAAEKAETPVVSDVPVEPAVTGDDKPVAKPKAKSKPAKADAAE